MKRHEQLILEDIYASMYDTPIEEGWKEKLAGTAGAVGLGALTIHGMNHPHKDTNFDKLERHEQLHDYELGANPRNVSQLFRGDKKALISLVKTYLNHKRQPYSSVRIDGGSINIDDKSFIDISDLKHHVWVGRMTHKHGDDLAGWIINALDK